MNIPFPRVTYNQLRKIIEGYYEINKDVVSTLELFNFMFGNVHQHDIYGSAGFLVSINVLEKADSKGYYRTTDICRELGQAIKISDEDKESKLLKEIIKNNKTLKSILDRVEYVAKLSGSIKKHNFKNEIIKISGWEEKSKTNMQYYDVYALTIINIFKKAKLVYNLKKDDFAIYHEPDTFEFINSNYINELIKLNKTIEFDLTRLINYCQQINSNYSNKKFESVAFLSRAIIHHIPPIFDQPNFQSLCSQTPNSKDSFKKSCANLQGSLKHIVDDLIHHPITSAETPLAEQEINFSPDLNRLIRGVIDKLRSRSGTH